ncbi:hypothetical protein Mapa_014391 [Marchantia paleacea]|nr:hypothetical protein Mapa_014391 [Marchantia paleacea]
MLLVMTSSSQKAKNAMNSTDLRMQGLAPCASGMAAVEHQKNSHSNTLPCCNFLYTESPEESLILNFFCLVISTERSKMIFLT